MDKVALTLPPPLQSRAEWKFNIFVILFPNVFSSFTKCINSINSQEYAQITSFCDTVKYMQTIVGLQL